MSEIMQRLGFGCGRLTGGWESSHSQRLLETALACGIRYFDTAPYYGGGDSERLVGKVLQASGQIAQVCTKVGLYPRPAPAKTRARSMLVAGLRTFLPDFALQRLKRRSPAPVVSAAPRSFGDFDPASMRASLDRSLEALRCEQVDALLLHEPALSDPQPRAAEMLASFVKRGKVKRLGVGTYAALEDLPPFGSIAQFGIGRGSLDDRAGRSLIIHGLLRHADFSKLVNAATDAAIPAMLPSFAQRSRDEMFLSGLLLNVVIAGTGVERVIVSSGSPKRLQAFVGAAVSIHTEFSAASPGELQRRMRRAAAGYLGVKTPTGGC
jgi:hypothetical protein